MTPLRAVLVLLALALSAPGARAQQQPLRIWLIDVEGGGSTLFVSPTGETLLVDTGNGGQNATRDADRIMAAIRAAGVSRIDHLITTHWHGDHYGAMREVAGRVPIAEFIDHGPTVETAQAAIDFLRDVYPTLYQGARHTVASPGDRVDMSGLEVTVVTSGKRVIDRPVAGGGAANPYCSAFVPQEEDMGENAQSVGIHVRFGEFRLLHLGDLTVNTERELMCPTNPIGTVDLWVVSHHGQPISNAAVLVHAIQPRVAIMNNGTRKGGQPAAMQVIHSAPGLEDLWQLHFSQLSGQEYTVPGMFIANGLDQALEAMPIEPITPPTGRGAPPAPAHNGQAYWIAVSARQDGSFSVTNARNGFTKTYGGSR